MSQSPSSEKDQKVFLDSVIFKVQILPQKYKIIKTPVHLYGELVKTDEGARYLKSTNDVEYFKKEILSSETSLLRKRAALWTIGHIGSTEQGFQLLQEADIPKEIVNLAQNSEILSLRG
jgi:rapamycin-insensitive companion of mTOR